MEDSKRTILKTGLKLLTCFKPYAVINDSENSFPILTKQPDLLNLYSLYSLIMLAVIPSLNNNAIHNCSIELCFTWVFYRISPDVSIC